MTVNDEKQRKETRDPRETLYDIAHAHAGRVYAVIGASTPQAALERARAVRHMVHMPRQEVLEARAHKSAAVDSPYFASAFFEVVWDCYVPDACCPVCGK